MAGNPIKHDSIPLRRVLPWIHLSRAFRIAIDFRKLLLAALALMALAGGDLVFSHLPFAPPAFNTDVQWPWEQSAPFGHWQAAVDDIKSETQVTDHPFLSDPWRTGSRMTIDWQLLVRPLQTVLKPASVLFQTGNTWSDAAYAWTQLLWALLVWSIFGGAITRMAAVQFATDRHIGLKTSLTFSRRRAISYLSAPLMALAGVGCLWLMNLLGGLFGRIPVVGEGLLGVFWFLPLGISVLMTLMLIGLAAGWPLMQATISVEGSDGFDGLSRPYSYIYNRPWYYLWLVFAATVLGSVLTLGVWMLAQLVVHIAAWSIASGSGLERTQQLLADMPAILGGAEMLGGTSAAPVASVGTVAGGVWLKFLATLLVGFVYSYFWTAAVIAYFLLRQSGDGTDLQRVYLEKVGDDGDNALPLAGVAASEQPIIERPLTEANDEQPESPPANHDVSNTDES